MWAKIHNLKQVAKTINFLTENKIEQCTDLLTRIEESTAASEQAGDSLKDVEKPLSYMAAQISGKLPSGLVLQVEYEKL